MKEGKRKGADPRRAEIRRQVRRVLRRSPAFARLEAERRRELTYALERTIGHASAGRIGVVDFPGFVAGLIGGVFEAIVGASIQQMEAYADLLDSVTESLDRFVDEAVEDDAARGRQQLLATMVLMGINRIVVTRGKIRLRSVLDEEDDD